MENKKRAYKVYQNIVSVGIYYSDGSTDGEFDFVFETIGNQKAIELKSYDDSWVVFPFFKDLFEKLPLIANDELDIEDFITLLESLDIKEL